MGFNQGITLKNQILISIFEKSDDYFVILDPSLLFVPVPGQFSGSVPTRVFEYPFEPFVRIQQNY